MISSEKPILQFVTCISCGSNGYEKYNDITRGVDYMCRNCKVTWFN